MREKISLVARLRKQLELIEKSMLELLDKSRIGHIRGDPEDTSVIVFPFNFWEEANEEEKRLQLELKDIYSRWFEHFRLLFANVPVRIQKEINDTHDFVMSWIEKSGGLNIPDTIGQAKTKFTERMQVYRRAIQLREDPTQDGPVLVLDTNALIAAPDLCRYVGVAGQENYSIVLVPTVLAQLDRLKVSHRDEKFRAKVESVIKRIKGLRGQGNVHEGVTVSKTIRFRMMATEPNFAATLPWLDPANEDDRIIASALEVQRFHLTSVVIIVTSDINLQNKAEMANLPFAETPGAK